MRRLGSVALVACAVAPGCAESYPKPAPPAELSIGGGGAFRLAVRKDGKSLRLTRGGTEELVRLAEGGIQLGMLDSLSDTASYDPYYLDPAIAPPPSDLVWQGITGGELAAEGGEARGRLAFGGASARLAARADASGRFLLSLDVEDEDPAAPRVAFVRLRLRVSRSEAFYGLGERHDSVDQRGKLRPMQIEPDGEVETLYTEVHVPIPLLVGTRGWGTFVESKRVGVFDVARGEPDVVEITYALPPLKGARETFKVHLFGAAHPLDVTKSYYDVTGYPLLPPRWGLGPVMWRNENREQAQVADDLEKLRALDLPATGMWLDRPYATAVNTFDFDPKKFPSPAAMVDAIRGAGLRLAVWHTPYLEPAAEPLVSEAKAKGYFVPRPSIPLNKWSVPIDFTNPAAVEFWQKNLQRYVAAGVEGFKLDFAEDVAPSLRAGRNAWGFFDGSDERTMHHDFTVLYHRTYREKVQNTPFLLCRAGRWGDQANATLIWPSDMDATLTKHREKFKDAQGADVVGIGGLPATVIMGLGLGVSGFPFFASDTGGYRHGPADKETWVRWAEQTALWPAMEVGDGSSTMPWESPPGTGRDAESLDVYRAYARLHLRLFPFFWSYATRIAADGRPIARPFGLAFPELGAHPDDQYMLGDELLAAPVMTKGQTSRKVLLPPGEWLDWFDGDVHRAASALAPTVVEVRAPLGKAPLFLRRGGVVPMLRPTIDTLNPVTPGRGLDSYDDDRGFLYVRAFAQRSGVSWFSLYDRSTVFVDRGDGSTLALELAGPSEYRGLVAEVVGVPAPRVAPADLPRFDTVSALEAAPRGYAWLPAFGGTLWVKSSSRVAFSL